MFANSGRVAFRIQGLDGRYTQLLRNGLGAATLAGQAQSFALKDLVALSLVVGRRPAHFGCHHRTSILPASVRLP